MLQDNIKKYKTYIYKVVNIYKPREPIYIYICIHNITYNYIKNIIIYKLAIYPITI